MHYVWLALFNPMTWESQDGVISVHKTKLGATKAVEKHKILQKKEYFDLYEFDPDKEDKWEDYCKNFLDWRVKRAKLKD